MKFRSLFILFFSLIASRGLLAQSPPAINGLEHSPAGPALQCEFHTNATILMLETKSCLSQTNWNECALQRLPLQPTTSGFYLQPTSSWCIARFRCETNTTFVPRRLRMLNNGYFLTVNPHAALSPTSTSHRSRLYVVHSVLIDPDTGRIAAIYPPFEEDAADAPAYAQPITSYVPQLSQEMPPDPGIAPDTAITWWNKLGIDSALLEDLDVVNLRGAVVTPGIIDGHFHVTSWSKKLPAEGDMFGFFADVSDPSYYIEEGTLEHFDAEEALTRIVHDANIYLADNIHTGILLHGYVYTMIDPGTTNPAHEEIFLYERNVSATNVIPSPDYLINGIGRNPDPETSLQAALLVHTSGQSCWYNARLHQQYNEMMGMMFSNRFPETAVTNIIPATGDSDIWAFSVYIDPRDTSSVLDLTPPFSIDLMLDGDTSFVQRAWIPFEVVSVSNTASTMYAQPVRTDVADKISDTATGASIVPFYRPIPATISTNDWNAAAAFYDLIPTSGDKAYGQWDPRNPYNSNWYNGSERGLVEYYFDNTGHVWRPTGYAEHYVMRDVLGSIVLSEPTVEDGMQCRRNLVRWCHRHGITGVNDIMFYRRASTGSDFASYEALSYEHDPVTDPAFFTNRNLALDHPTGRFHLRVGMYYYIENLDQISDVLTLAVQSTNVHDTARLRPPDGHQESPGWIRWTGWKLQLDGGTGARTFFSSAPIAKPYISDAYPTHKDTGIPITYSNHTFGLLTMTTDQEQIFDSRETAALYWLMRESNPTSIYFNASMLRDWTILQSGVINWLGQNVNPIILAHDLRQLTNVNMTVTQPDSTVDEAAVMAQSVQQLIQQVNSGYSNTLQAIARLWYEHSKAVHRGIEVPGQVACHCDGDAGVDLWLCAIRQLQQEIPTLPLSYNTLPRHWKYALPPDADLNLIQREFTNQRYRVEHLLNISAQGINLVKNSTSGIDRASSPASRNIVFSTQPALLATDGRSFRAIGFPVEQELWDIPSLPGFREGLPPLPRYDHHMACPVYLTYDIPFSINTDPPSVRDPRPAINLMAAVSRCPIEVNPGAWLDQSGPEPDYYPPDYLIGRVFSPLGLQSSGNNPMQLTIEQALCAMTYWSAYNAGWEHELGAIADERSSDEGAGWFADMVIWEYNPLAIANTQGHSIHHLGRYYDELTPLERVHIANTFLQKFRPSMTIVGGQPVYCSPNGAVSWQANRNP